MHMHVVLVVPLLSKECQPNQAEHVERSQHGRQQSHRVQRFSAGFVVESRKQNRILREKRRKREEAGDCDGAEQHAPECHLNLRREPAHVPHILLAAHRMDHASGGKEQQRLEERVRHQVEDSCAERAYTTAQEHVTKLADRRIGQHLLNIRLHQSNRCCKERGGAAYDRYDVHRRRRMCKQDV